MGLATWIASGGGIGRLRFMPATAAAAVATIVGGLVLWGDPRATPLLVIAASVIGTVAIRLTGEQDRAPWIVIDDMTGIWVAMLGLARFSFSGTIAAFLIFWALRVTRPGPVAWADSQDGAFARMADDISAGLIAAAILYVLRLLMPVFIWLWLPFDQLP